MAIGLAIVVLFSPVAGDQAYEYGVTPPVAVGDPPIVTGKESGKQEPGTWIQDGESRAGNLDLRR